MKTNRHPARHAPRSIIEPLEARIAPATFIVTSLSDVIADDGELTLREAASAANDTPAADTIQFAPTLTGTITLALGTINITETLKIIGGGKITLSGNDAVRIFSVNNADTVKDHPLTVSGLRFVGGNAGATGDGGAINSSEGLMILNCTFADNTAGDEGGAVRVVTSTGFVVVKDSHFSDNTSGNGAGGLQAGSAKGITLTGSVFAGNVGGFAGGASLGVESEKGKITVSGCTFAQNESAIAGGGLSVGGSRVSIVSSTFSDNTADLHGGGLAIAGGSYALASLKFIGNSAPEGGAISSKSGAKSIALSKSLLEGNAATAGGGGGIYLTGVVDGFTAKISASQLIGNTATGGSGGGLLALDTGGQISVISSLISGNTASSRGGGLAIHQNDAADLVATLSGNTISGNQASNAGGLSLFRHGDFILSKNVISGNRATNSVGGVSFDVVGDVTFKNNQVVANRATSGIGAMDLVAGDTSTFKDSGNLIARNEGGTTGGLSILSGADMTISKTTKITGNIAGITGRGGGVSVESGGGAITLLGPVLGNYNRVDHAFDQTSGTIASGPAPAPGVAGNITVTNLADSGPGSLRAAIAQANATPAADKIKFADGLAGEITFTSQIDITERLTISGRGKITLSGDLATRIFSISNPDDKDHLVTVSGLTFAQGKGARGSAIEAFESLTVIDCLFVENNANDFSGGAIFAELENAALTVRGSHFTDNIGGLGGAIFASSKKALTITDTVFAGNISFGAGGGANLVASTTATKVSVTGSLFIGNGALDEGAGLAVRGFVEGTKASKVAVVNSSFLENESLTNGGGLRLEQGGFALAGVQVIGNAAAGAGGGISVSDPTTKLLTVSKSLIAENMASGSSGGGGVYLGLAASGFAANFTTTQILGNTSTNGSGGGLLADGIGGKLTVSKSMLAGNVAATGGGLASRGGAAAATNVVLTGNVIAGNEAGTGAGLALTGDGALALTKNAIVANYATADVGGARLESTSTIALKTNTVLANHSDNGIGGLLLRGPATASFKTAGDIIVFNQGTTGGLEIEQAIAGIIAKNVRITGNIALGTFNGGGITQESAGEVELLATVLGNLNRAASARNETFGLFTL